MTAPPMISPCVKVCVVDGESSLCLGCFRTLEEIAGWTRLTPERRDAIVAELPGRRRLIDPLQTGAGLIHRIKTDRA